VPKTTSSVIRLAKTKDAAAIAELSRSQIEKELPWRWRPGRVQQHIRAKDATVIVSESENSLCGFAITSFAETSAHISLLAVSPTFRRLGIATSMIRWISKSCQTAGIGCIKLEVRANNTGAIECYSDLGFQKRGIIKGYYESREDAQLMTLVLISSEIEARRPK
jgi:ribosomal-protein-alanine N-acetyltransferase|tara:strand:+ start:12814 stop:13308 length:495 start_codon:yes stop_codon:yes gene_type:complete